MVMVLLAPQTQHVSDQLTEEAVPSLLAVLYMEQSQLPGRLLFIYISEQADCERPASRG